MYHFDINFESAFVLVKMFLVYSVTLMVFSEIIVQLLSTLKINFILFMQP